MSTSSKVISEKVLAIVSDIIEVVERAKSVSQEETDPKAAFLKHVSSPMMGNEEFQILMELYNGCSIFRANPSGDVRTGNVNISKCNVTLGQAVKIMPHAWEYTVNTTQLMEAVDSQTSFSTIIVLKVLDKEREFTHRISSLKAFPNLETFSAINAENVEFSEPTSEECFSPDFKSFSARLGRGNFNFPGLYKLHVMPTGDAVINVQTHPYVEELLVTIDLVECEGKVKIDVPFYSELTVLNPNPKAFVEAILPKKLQRKINIGNICVQLT